MKKPRKTFGGVASNPPPPPPLERLRVKIVCWLRCRTNQLMESDQKAILVNFLPSEAKGFKCKVLT